MSPLIVAPAVALWALLAIVASQRLGLEADGYGALFGALGLGAIIGAFVLAAANLMQIDQLIAGVVLLSLLGLTVSALLSMAERVVLRWR